MKSVGARQRRRATSVIKLVVDLNRCQGCAQCAFLAPDVFTLHGEEALMYAPVCDDAQREHGLRAAATCPIRLDQDGLDPIPRGATVLLALGSGNRDERCFTDPERFRPERPDNQHLGFGSGIHNCFGAPPACLETQLALTALARRLRNPALVEDPPPYRQNPALRGPRHLPIAFQGLQA